MGRRLRGSLLATLPWLGTLGSSVASAQLTADEPLTIAQVAEGGPPPVDEFHGSYQRVIPIQVPAFRGIEPALTLQYASTATNGAVGVGFNLGGFPMIERATPGKGVPRYDDGDVFLLDGQELVRCPCTTGSSCSPSCTTGGTHATKIESYQRIAFQSGTWTVWQPSGVKATFAPRFITTKGTFRWGLASVTDTLGNAVSYEWTCEGSPHRECYPARVTYGPTVIELGWVGRPDPVPFATGAGLGSTQRRLRYIDVKVSAERIRLYRIAYMPSESSGRSLVKSLTQYGRGATLTAAGSDWVASGPKLPAMTFDYTSRGAPPYALGSPTEWLRDDRGGWAGSDPLGDVGYRLLGDFNGDQRTDLMFLDHWPQTADPKAWRVALAADAGFYTPVVWLAEASQPSGPGKDNRYHFVADFDGNGNDDYLYLREGDGWYVALSNGSGFDPITKWGEPSMVPTGFDREEYQYVGDFNGDGRADYMYLAADGWYVAVARPPANKTDTWRFGAATRWIGSDAVGLAPGMGGTCVRGWAYQRVADFNGDGKTDILYFRGDGWYVASSTGSAFVASRWLARSAAALDGVSNLGCEGQYVADFNGDGLPDLLYLASSVFLEGFPTQPRIYVALSSGGGFLPPDVWLDDTRVPTNYQMWWGWEYYLQNAGRQYVGDFNGDGKADWMYWGAKGASCGWWEAACGIGETTSPTEAGWYVALSTGAFFSDPTGWAFEDSGPIERLSSDSAQYAADFNGDGRTDLMVFGENRIPTCIPEFNSPWPNRREAAYCSDYSGTCSCLTGLRIMAPGWRGWYVALSGTNRTLHDLIETVENGYGGTTSVAYARSSQWPGAHGVPLTPTVLAVKVSDGLGGEAETRYTYSGGLYDWLDRRFLGFRYVKTILPCVNGACPYRETWFKQDYGSASKPEEIRTASCSTAAAACVAEASGQLLSASRYEYTTNDATIPYTSLLSEEYGYAYGADGSSRTSRRSITHYDQYGNVLQEVQRGDADRTGDERTIVTTYAVSTNKYIIAKPAQVTVIAGVGSGPRLHQTRMYYDHGALEAAPTAGLVTKVERRFEEQIDTFVSTEADYDAYGNVIAVTNEVGARTEHVIDSIHHLFPEEVRDPLCSVDPRHRVTARWDAGCGVETETWDMNGQKTSLGYDEFCRPTTTDLPGDGFATRSYNNFGDVAGQFVMVATPAADSSGNLWQKQYFDGLGRVYRTVAKGPIAGKDIIQETSYTTRGKPARVSTPQYAGEARYFTELTYDGLDRVIKTSFPDGAKLKTEHGAWATTEVDPLFHKRTRTFDAFGNLLTSSEWRGDKELTTRYEYDSRDKLKQVTDPVGNVWSYEFDSLGRKRKVIDPDAGTWTYEYDNADRLTLQIDGSARTTSFEYDALGRQRKKTVLRDTPSAQIVEWIYDEARDGGLNVGQVTTMRDPAGEATYDYDHAGRVINETRSLDGMTHVFRYGYDAGGRPLWTQYPDGGWVGTQEQPLGYDGAGRLQRIPGIASAIEYDAAGRMIRQVNGNGTISTRAYSPQRGWLTRIGTGKGSAVIQDLDLSRRNAEGNLEAIRSPIGGESWDYAYDGLHRLRSATRDPGAASARAFDFQYDDVGNITRSPVGRFLYGEAGPHAVTKVMHGARCVARPECSE